MNENKPHLFTGDAARAGMTLAAMNMMSTQPGTLFSQELPPTDIKLHLYELEGPCVQNVETKVDIHWCRMMHKLEGVDIRHEKMLIKEKKSKLPAELRRFIESKL